MNKHNMIFFLIISGLFICGSMFLYQQVPIHAESYCDIDSQAYIQRGDAWSLHKTFALYDGEKKPYYALGYPFFIGLIMHSFGKEKIWVIFVQMLLTIFCFFIIAYIAKRLFGQLAFYCACILSLGNLGYFIFTQFILTEVILSLLLLLFMIYMTIFLQQSKQVFFSSSLFWAGFFLGCSLIIKPVALFLIPFLTIIIFCNFRKLWIKQLVVTFFFILAVSICPSVFVLYTKTMFNTYSLSNLGAVNMYYWYLPNLLAEINGTLASDERIILQNLNNDDQVKKVLWQTVKKRPIVSLYIWIKNMIKTLFGLYISNLKVLLCDNIRMLKISFFHGNGDVIQKIWQYITAGFSSYAIIILGFYEIIYSLIRYILWFFGLRYLIVLRQWKIIGMYILVIGYCIGITGHDGCARFRMMIEGILIPFSAGGLSNIINIFCINNKDNKKCTVSV